MSEKPILIDATNLILGRLASYTSKRILQGNHVIVINVEKAVVSGKRSSATKKARERLKTRTLASLEKSPKHPKRPDTFFRHVVRRMLPSKKPKSKEAYKRLKVFIGVPEELKDKSAISIKEADASKLRCPYISLEDFAEELGWVK
ncbi:MAG: 50S ribosomal protein L13 [Candidatus Bathyarchaeia archaeon]